MGGVVKAVASVVTKFAGGFNPVTFFVGLAVNFAISFVAKKLFAPKAPSLQQPSYTQEAKDRQVVIKSAVQDRRIVYGRTVLSGALVFATTTSNKRFLHMVIAMIHGRIAEIEQVILNDTLSTDSKFSKTRKQKVKAIATQAALSGGVYKIQLTLNGKTFTGSQAVTTQTSYWIPAPTTDDITDKAVDSLISAIQGDAGYSGENYTVSKSRQRKSLNPFKVNAFGYQGIVNVTAKTAGSGFTVADGGLGTWNIQTIQANLNESFVTISKHLGDINQAADSSLESAASQWTSTHRLRGIAYFYARLKGDQDKFPTGVPNLKALVRGREVYDPRGDKIVIEYSGANAWANAVKFEPLLQDVRCTSSADAAEAPDGQTTAVQVQQDSSLANNHYTYENHTAAGVTFNVGETWHFTGYFRFGVVTNYLGISIAISDLDGGQSRVVLDQNGNTTLTVNQNNNITNITAEAEKDSAGLTWWRVDFDFEFTDAGAGSVVTYLIFNETTNTNDIIFDGNGSDTFFAWGLRFYNTAVSESDPIPFKMPSHGLSVADHIFIRGHKASSAPVFGAFYVETVVDTDNVELIKLSNPGDDFALTRGGVGGYATVMSWSDNWALCVLDYLVSGFGLAAGENEINFDDIVTAANVSDEQVALTSTTETFTADASTDLITMASDGVDIRTGDIVQVSSSGTLPAGLAALTNYYFINRYVNDQREAYLASSLGNAREGIAIDITDAGSGTHTIEHKSQLRYTCNGAINLNTSPASIIEALVSGGAGEFVYSQGAYRLYAGAYDAPTISADEDWLRGPMNTVPTSSRRELFNAVRGTFVAPNRFYQPTSFPPVRNSSYETADGEVIYQNIELGFTDQAVAAQRLGKIMLEKSRQGIVVKMPCNFAALQCTVGDVISLSISILGWSSKAFRVLEWEFSEEGGIDLTLREESAASYSWAAGEETALDPAPNTDLPNPFEPPAEITGLAAASGTDCLIDAGDGTLFSRVCVMWDAITDENVLNGGYIEFAYKRSNDSVNEWTMARFEPTFTGTYIQPVVDGEFYDIRVKPVNSFGVGSDEATFLLSHEVIGKSAPPSDVTSLTVSQNGDVVVFQWPKVFDSDLAGFILKYQAQSTYSWDSATLISEVTKGTQITTAVIPPGAWTFAIKAVDLSGNESDTAATFNITVTSAFDIIKSVTEETLWRGVLENFTRHWSGVLVPHSQDADATAADVFDEAIPRAADASYITKEIDVGFTDTVRAYLNESATPLPGVSGSPSVTYEMDAYSYDDADELLETTIDYSYGGWGKTNITLEGDRNTLAPDGTTTASVIAETSATGVHDLSNYGAAAALDDIVVGEWYVKRGNGSRNVRLYLYDATNTVNLAYADLDLDTGAITQHVGTWTVSETAFGFYRVKGVSVAVGPLASSNIGLLYRFLNGASQSYAGDPTQTLIVWRSRYLTQSNFDGFGTFEDFAIGFLQGRSFQAKLQLSGAVPSFLGALKFSVDVEERTLSGNGETIDPGGETITFSTPFHNVPSIVATAVSGSAKIVTISSITTTSFNVNVWDTGGVDVGGDIDWRATGA